MLKRTERQVFFYDLVIKSRAKHAVPPSLSEIVSVWKLMFDSKACSHEREKGAVVYRIGDISVDDAAQVARMLIRRCDVNASNAVYSHRKTGAPRVLAREPDEGGDRAAHLVVSLKQETAKPHVYLCHLEGVPGLSHNSIQATLNAILKAAIKSKSVAFVYPDPSGARNKNGDPKTSEFQPTVELIGHPSPALVDDLEKGQLHDIVLVDQRPSTPFNGSAYLTENEYRVRVKAQPNIPSQNRFKTLVSSLQTKKGEFQTARVRFKDPDGIERSVDIDIATGAFEQQSYIQSYRVTGIDPPMDESSLALVPFLTEEMQARVIKERS